MPTDSDSESSRWEYASLLHRDSTLAVTEVLARILGYLPVKDLLLAQRVCTHFHTTIRDSPDLQVALFLRPVRVHHDRPIDGYTGHKNMIPKNGTVLNPLLLEKFNPAWFAGPRNDARWSPYGMAKLYNVAAFFQPLCPRAYEKAYPREGSSNSESNNIGGTLEMFTRAEASWRRMLPCQPSPAYLAVRHTRYAMGGTARQTGVLAFSDGSSKSVSQPQPSDGRGTALSAVEDKSDLSNNRTKSTIQSNQASKSGVNLEADIQALVHRLGTKLMTVGDLYDLVCDGLLYSDPVVVRGNWRFYREPQSVCCVEWPTAAIGTTTDTAQHDPHPQTKRDGAQALHRPSQDIERDSAPVIVTFKGVSSCVSEDPEEPELAYMRRLRSSPQPRVSLNRCLAV